LTLVVALGALGVGYALWWDELYIDVLIDTGEVEADLSVEYFGDTEIFGKDVSSIDAYLIDDDTLWVDLTDAYPCIDYYVSFNIECNGTVPIHFVAPELPVGFPGTVTLYDNGTPATVAFYPPFGPSNPAPPLMDWTLQMHPGDVHYVLMVIHLDNSALENTTYGFGLSIYYHQYNEAWDPSVLE